MVQDWLLEKQLAQQISPTLWQEPCSDATDTYAVTVTGAIATVGTVTGTTLQIGVVVVNR